MAPTTSCRTGPRLSACDIPGYVAALLIGIAAVGYFLPSTTISGSGGFWVNPGGDLAENLTGHLAFQSVGWQWPPLVAPNMAWPHGTSVAMTDSNPLVSLVAKVVAAIRGKPGNLLGLWLTACWLLQPVAAVYALRGFGCWAWEAEFSAAVFAILFPAMLARIAHINLMGHFLLLFALGMTLRMVRVRSFPTRRWFGVAGLLTVAVFCHPYLYVFAAAAFIVPALQDVINRKANAGRSIVCYLAAVAAPVALYAVASGTLGGGDRGFGFYSMNMLSPFWPQRSGLFGAARPVIDATGGQYEGFNYLGAGGLLLIAVAAVLVVLRRDLDWSRGSALVMILTALTLFAPSPHIYFGHTLVLSLGIKPWDQVFGAIQANGRAFWLVGYTLVLASIAKITRDLPRVGLRVVLIAAISLQLIDTAPLRAAARDYFAGRSQQPAAIDTLPGAHWLTIVPVCGHPGRAAEVAGELRLGAVRAGMWLRDMRVSRLPHWFNCESALTDGVEMPLLPREMRVFLEPPATTLFRQAALGPDISCRSVAQMIVCARDLALHIGAAVAPGTPLPELVLPASDVTGGALKKLCSYGWHEDDLGLFWSEGPRASLLFHVLPTQPAGALLLHLQIDGVARSPGAVRRITVRVGAAPSVDIALPDMQTTTVDLRVLNSSISDGIVRVAFDIDHPVEPRARGLMAPVGRAGVRLSAVGARWVEGLSDQTPRSFGD